MSSQQSERRTIARDDLVVIVDKAADGVADSTREKLVAVARTTDAVAVGWFHCDGVSCPARQARRQNRRFQEAFDRAMYDHFGLEYDEDYIDGTEPFVVVIADALTGERSS